VVIIKGKEKSMAKLIIKELGILLSVNPTDKTKDDVTWMWRKKYEGFLGIIHVYKSESKYPDKHFIAIYDVNLHCLKTSTGELSQEGDILKLTTVNSIYTFKTINIDGKENE
jgi:hypothetical protein